MRDGKKENRKRKDDDDISDVCAWCSKGFKYCVNVDGHIAKHFMARHWNMRGGIRGRGG